MRNRRPVRWAAVTAALVAAAGCGESAPDDAVAGTATPTPVDAATASTTLDGDDVVTFTDVAADVGVDFRHGAFNWSVTADPNAMMGAGLCWIDVDRDGWLDLFVVNTWSEDEWHRWDDTSKLPTTRLYRNDGGTFSDVTDEWSAGVEARGNGCVAADLDRDGFADLYLTTERQNVLLWNDGGQRFERDDGSSGANAYGWHAGAAVGDVDRDGWPDIYVAGYADLNRPIADATQGFPNTFTPEPDLLLLSDGAASGDRPKFRDVANDVGLGSAGDEYGLGSVLSDVDRDGDLDIYVANDTKPNRLYLSEVADEAGRLAFVDVSGRAGVDDDNAGMGIAAGDYDADGRPDLVVTNMAEQGHDVFTSDEAAESATFSSALEPLGLEQIGQVYTGWGVSWADLDLDGDLDLTLAHGAIPVTDLDADRQPVQLFAQVGDPDGQPRFEPMPLSADPSSGGYLARGMAAADYDNDGDVDLAIGSIGNDLALLRNDGADGHWLTVDPRPSTPGTTISILTGDGEAQYREILAGSSYLSSEDPRAHFGFGDESDPVTVEVRWPDGATQTLEDVDLDQLVVVRPAG